MSFNLKALGEYTAMTIEIMMEYDQLSLQEAFSLLQQYRQKKAENMLEKYLQCVACSLLENFILEMPIESSDHAWIKAQVLQEEYEDCPDSKESGTLILQLTRFVDSLCHQEKVAA